MPVTRASRSRGASQEDLTTSSRSSRAAARQSSRQKAVPQAPSKSSSRSRTRISEPEPEPGPSKTNTRSSRGRTRQAKADPPPRKEPEAQAGPSKPSKSRERTRILSASRKEKEKEPVPENPGPSKPSTSYSKPRERKRLSAPRKEKDPEPVPPSAPSKPHISRPPNRKEPLKAKGPALKLGRGRARQPTTDPAAAASVAVPVNDENDPPPSVRDPLSLFLPPKHLFPPSEQSHSQRTHTLNGDFRTEILKVVSRIFGIVQDEGAPFLENYDRMERLYEYVDEVAPNDVELRNKYRVTCVSVMWQFGAVVWKQIGTGANVNTYAERVSNFMRKCLVRLGWDQDLEWRRKVNKWKWKMNRWKKDRLVPAAYHAVKQFVRTHSDTSTTCRITQLNLMLDMATTAYNSDNTPFLEYMFKTIFTCLQIRLKDKSTPVRALAMSLLAKFVDIQGAEDAVLKQLKFFTRFDPSIEVRRIGTNAIGRNDRTRIRFFFDQAFDKNPSVRAEAYRVLGMHKNEENSGMLRDMGQLQPEKLCKLITWGLNYSDSKCSALLKHEVLPNWLKYSCDNSLIKFLSNLDAYANMKAVLKILDIMLTTDEQMRFVEELDFSFIADLKLNIVRKQYGNVTIEAMVAWLSLCKASDRIPSIRSKVVPTGEDMVLVLQCLHECAFLEHDKSQLESRIEDVSPIICTVVALQITKFVVWEEGGRRTLQTLLKNMLLDPVMDERVLIMQAMYKLLDHVQDKQDFEDIMMSVFQDVFDSRNSFNRMTSIAQRRRSSLVDRSVDLHRRPLPDNPKEEVNFFVQGQGQQDQDEDDGNPEPEVGRNGVEQESMREAPEPAQAEQAPVRLTSYQMTKLREKLCDLALNRYNLTRKRDALIAEKKFIDAIPLNDEIMRIQQEETEHNAQLKLQEELAKQPPPPPPPPPPQQQAVRTPAQSPAPSSAAVSIAAEEELPQGQEFERMEEDMEEDEEGEGLADQTGVINSVEEGLAKGIFMINTYLDLIPDQGLHPFFRNFYENYVPQFMMERDLGIRQAIFNFLVRVALSDKREMKKIANTLVILLLSDCECEIRNIAFKGLVDIIIRYEYEDFVISQEEREREDAVTTTLKKELTKHLQLLVSPNLTYENATSVDMAKMLLEVLTKRFPPSSQQLSNQEKSLLLCSKNQGLLKLLVAGYIKDPSILARVIMLWVNHDYSGTPILRDLENVLNLYNTFEWWGTGPGNVLDEDEEEDTEYAVERTRILGIAIAEATVLLCQEGKGIESESISKFVGHMIEFLDHRDQSLMRAISSTILSPVLQNPTRSYNTTLIRAASHVPLTNLASAKRIVHMIDMIYKAMRDHPPTQSLTALKKDINHLLSKFKRVHGEEVLVVEGLNGRTRVVGTDFVWGDEPFLDGNGSFSGSENPHVEVFSESDNDNNDGDVE